ncbi:hypothetical protein [Hydrogenovibrio marinus]|uniref:Uncharacterized protein n=1 Tax=Hydrogenovibrio marinus TaxID=28885 RepID=A0A066ZM05_HYDMR|nr:hypothetical protein [Hydrogenovibrio marinus]KDN94843.1 hypothetical protein EI16_00575 [Hydrogenovibrio marinus]BBN59303.1 hypothetical protein HVMH_0897 [Hydrogenovibrio marinus]
MINTPKMLQTKQDIDNAIANAGTAIEKAKIIDFLNGLIESAYQYDFDRNLGDTESPDGAEPDYIVVENTDMKTNVTTRQQLKRAENTTARLFNLGYQVADVQSLIISLEA